MWWIISLPVTPEILAGDVVIATDSTGVKVTNRGEWMRVWQARHGWIKKVHAMIDVHKDGLVIPGELHAQHTP
jgi:hypothetical protein